MTNERTQAVALANRLLDEPNCDPDDDLRVLSRQLLRAVEVIDRVRAGEPPADAADTRRLDFLEQEGFDANCLWKNSGWAGGDRWWVKRYLEPGVSAMTVREAIDKAIAAENRT